ncbi:P-loop containing nucleoside triphosphate hydrolase protein [Gonapodya prolifera JEL478]|uniref:p-loop containing nucleoside triphosphate hydrolase protein n=1 Tax=Gonapodya prolifera (strain JEL478) TaxID=1344416 RepID=A0A139AT51_GONPJ|nr:P-loop containing nucleoside triphosphate hydrolase protein [Gonapodya prolifera JEL478]|eukprot:KXS19901.1 P-loop containing nucleoside triphosphate hydrolase protein [Gonapodya prolifera JEL478]
MDVFSIACLLAKDEKPAIIIDKGIKQRKYDLRSLARTNAGGPERPGGSGTETGRENQFKIVAFYGHKGGVGKTTTTHSVAWALAMHGKAVVLVDMDAQCNLTQLSVGGDVERAGVDVWDQFERDYPTTGLSALNNLRRAGDGGTPQAPDLIEIAPHDIKITLRRETVFPSRRQ